ncbi:MAG: hypothetical protein MJ067_03805 [Oscillospiraceae bacterium]|nr:hypothetical protein [Oscillospiraceae bacterium]
MPGAAIIIIYLVIIVLVNVKKAKIKGSDPGKRQSTPLRRTGTEETHGKSAHIPPQRQGAPLIQVRESPSEHAKTHNPDGSHGVSARTGHKYTFCRHCGSQQCTSDVRCTSCGRRI